MREHLRRGVKDDSGQVAVLVAVMFLALVFAVALVVNTGLLFVERRAAQEAADSAALSGALRLAATGSPAAATTAATEAAGLNGYSSGVTVTIPPASGPNAGNPKFVEVRITTNRPALLTPQWGATAVSARAVAGGGNKPAKGIYSLGSGSGSPGLTIQNGGVIGIYDENAPVGCSYDPTASPNPWVGPPASPRVDCSRFGGAAQVNSTATDAGRSLGSPGGIIGPPTVIESFVGSGGTCTNVPLPHPKFPGASCGNPTQSDPYSPYPKPVPVTESVPVPGSINWCRQDTPASNLPLTVCGSYGSVNGCAGSLILQPGFYTGVIQGSCDYILKPGVYVFSGDSNSGIKSPSTIRVLGNVPGDTFELLSGQQSPPGLIPYTRDASSYTGCGVAVPNSLRCGVLLFFTYPGYPGAPTGGGCATLTISGGRSADLAPEPGGTWQGMLMYSDTSTQCADANVTIGGGADVNGTSFRGLIYAPKANLTMVGNTSTAVLSQIVVNRIDVQNALVVVNVGAATVRASAGLRLTE